MTEEINKLVKETFIQYFSGDKELLLETIDQKMVKQYQEAMLRLETDFDYQQELGIGL